MDSIRKGLLRVAFCALCASYVHAFALVNGVTTSLWPWAGKMGGQSNFYTSGVAIGDHWILTARHAVWGFSPDGARFQLDGGQTYASIAIYTNPTDDIAIIRVAETIPGWYDPYWGGLESGQPLEQVGYGASGTLNGGVWSFNNDYGTKRRGVNRCAGIQFVDFGGDPVIRGTWLIYDFDGPALDFLGDGGMLTDECTLGGGDSGGPTFINDAGTWKVAGLHSWIGTFSGGPAPPQYGSAFGDLRVGSYRTWFESIVPAEVFATGLTMFRGSATSGTITLARRPDDAYLVVRPGVVFSNVEAPVQAIITGTSPVAATTELHFCLETRASAPNITQNVDLMNFSTGLYEPVNSQTAAITDSVYEYTETSNPSRFIQGGTLAVQARLSFKAQGAVFAYPWLVSIDRAVWNIKR